jgi:hypothetical protein
LGVQVPPRARATAGTGSPSEASGEPPPGGSLVRTHPGAGLVTADEFERIEGSFHDALGTFAELRLINELLALAELPGGHDEAPMRSRIADALARLAADPRRAMLEGEVRNIENAVREAAQALLVSRPAAQARDVSHTARAYAGGAASDVVLEWQDGETTRVSIKTDKSGRVALAGVGQTSVENWAKALYGFEPTALDELARSRTGMSLEEAKSDYQDIAHLAQHVVIDALGVESVVINDWSAARATDPTGVLRLLSTVRRHLSGSDDAITLILDRQTGRASSATVMDALDIRALDPARLSFTPCRPKYRFGTTLGIKLDGKKLFDHQVKRQRGARPSQRFRDVTTRVERPRGGLSW